MRSVFIGVVLFLSACGADQGLRMTSGADWHAYVQDPGGGRPGTGPDGLRFRPGLCNADELHPEYARLDETSLTRFLERQHVDARIERPRADLLCVNIGG